MSSRKDLKKLINNSMGLLYNDCIFYKVFTHSPNVEKANEIILQIADVHTDLINRLSTSEGKEIKSRTKAYYKKVKEDLKTQLDKFGLEIQKLD
ncbi:MULTISPECIES: hypothetical protein [unclassified Dysgonomonas]|uniref:hypothetical protein n=1 Tax=unclassified Dysgonomonas TaxID=2630389 RepID=UPI0006829AF7|nr:MULTISPECIES: hypothetical protein [unclassified Dysgonomonas]MBD8346993.1 hypothetical protein [Dysgonomonas sp. HGC4]MBF0575073.1 hypothetical protein [Dysgonomonas sp. GY617]